MLLFFVVLQPMTTSLLGEHGDQPLPTVIYALSLAATGLASTVLWLHAFRVGLVNPAITRGQGRFMATLAVSVPSVFLLSVPLALFNPFLAEVVWLLIWPAQVILRRRFDRAFPPAEGEHRT
jgi:uncharacterized membrane protein